MGYFADTCNVPQEDYVLLKNLKRIRKVNYEERQWDINSSYYSHRTSMPSYMRQLLGGNSYKYKAEAVYKRISSGVGKNALSNLIRYLTRTQQEQIEQNIKKMDIFNSEGVALDETAIKEVMLEWQEDFISKKFREKYPNRFQTLEAFHKKNAVLVIAERKGQITQDEVYELAHMRRNGIEKNIWEYGTEVQFNNLEKGNIHKVLGDNQFLIKIIHNDKENFQILEKEHLEPLYTREGWQISPSLEVEDEKLSLDDSNYAVDTPNYKQAIKSLPKDFEHLIFSVGGDDPDEEKSHRATKQFLDVNLAHRGFRYLYAMHNDSKNLHFHVIVHRTNTLSKSFKFPTSLHDSWILRKEYADTLSDYGINRSVTLAKDRAKYFNIAMERAEKYAKTSRRFSSNKKNPDAENLFADHYTLNNYLDNLEVKLQQQAITSKEKKEIKSVIDISRVQLHLDDKESFDNAVSGLKNSLISQSEQVKEFWDDYMSANELEKYQDKQSQKKRQERAEEAQEKYLERMLQSYRGLDKVKKEVEDLQEYDVQVIDQLMYDIKEEVALSNKVMVEALIRSPKRDIKKTKDKGRGRL
jgi:hypothetical protein